MTAAIKGISKTSLWNTWKIIRKSLRYASVRDIIDHVDYDIDPDKWILRLLKQISSGKYEPATPFRFTLGKSNGFSRTITQPAIADLVLYRTIVDALYAKAVRKEHAHVYFKRGQLQKAQQTAQQQATQAVNWASSYRMTSQSSFYNWLKFTQYQKHLLLQSIHPYLVVTDVTNFFDSVLHCNLEEALQGLPVAPRMLGLLFYLLERLAIRPDYTKTHGIGLPVDEFDCSRTLAHLFLFNHDEAMSKLVGEGNYTRWMDDQNFGVNSTAEGLRVLSEVGKSLAKLHLSPNTKKSKIFTLAGARRHFHLDLNDMLEKAEANAKTAKTNKQRRALSSQLRQIWAKAQLLDGQGEFDKVLKRIYKLAGGSKARFLRRRALRDVLSNPGSAELIGGYMRCSGTVAEYLAWFSLVIWHDEQIYPDVNVALIESLFRLEAGQTEAASIRAIASAFLSGKYNLPGASDCKSLAPLLILRFGDKRSFPLLERCFADQQTTPSAGLLRAAAIVYSSYGGTEFTIVRKASSRLTNNHLADVVRLVERIREYKDVPARYRARLGLRNDPVAAMSFVDMRALLTVRLLHLSKAPKVAKWVADWKAKTLLLAMSDYDRRLLKRLL